MPKLLLFAPCEKLIIDEQKNPTLVCVLQRIGVTLPPNIELSKDLLAPREWDICTIWEPEEGDSKDTFLQHLEIILPDGSQSKLSAVGEFAFQEGILHRNNLHINGFPVGLAGEYKIKLWLESSKTKRTVVGPVSYPITVTHNQPEAPAAIRVEQPKVLRKPLENASSLKR
jgi:hypothetical protein